MNDTMSQNKINELIEGARHIGVFPSKVAGLDAFAAGAGLVQALKDKSKDVSLVYPGSIPDGLTDLVSESDVLRNVSERELEVAIDYSRTDASKVHYTTEGDILYLTIKPISKDFDLSNIKAQIKGFDFDLIFTIGAQALDDFGNALSELETEFSASKIINIDNTSVNRRFGDINIVDDMSDSISLLVLNQIPDWGMRNSTKTARILLKGISHRSLD